MGTICGSANDQTITIDGKVKQLGKKSSTSTKITDDEAWAHVRKLWMQKKLKKDEAMTFEVATPFITNYIKEIKGTKKIDAGEVRQIFNEIDEDGNGTLDQDEMF